MSGNRTKIDWAYRAAEKLFLVAYTDADKWPAVRKIADALRRAERRGYKRGCDKPCGNCGAGQP